MWQFDASLLEVFIRTGLVYLFILLGIRFTGKREVGSMTPLDLVFLLLIANAVQNAMTGPNMSLTGGLVAGLSLFVLNALLNRLMWKNKKVRKALEGEPTQLIHQGRLIVGALKKERVAEDELFQALREHGVEALGQVGSAVLEVDGSISVIKKEEMPSVKKLHHNIRFRDKDGRRASP